MLDPESIARHLLERARLDIGERISPRALAAALGFTLKVIKDDPHTHDTTLPGLIVFDGTERALFHGLAHQALLMCGFKQPHDERFVSAVGARLATPSYAFQRAVRWGAERERLAKEFGVSQTCAVLRRAELFPSSPAAVVTPSTIYGRGDWRWPVGDVLRRMLRERSKLIRQARLADDPRRILVVPR